MQLRVMRNNQYGRDSVSGCPGYNMMIMKTLSYLSNIERRRKCDMYLVLKQSVPKIINELDAKG